MITDDSPFYRREFVYFLQDDIHCFVSGNSLVVELEPVEVHQSASQHGEIGASDEDSAQCLEQELEFREFTAVSGTTAQHECQEDPEDDEVVELKERKRGDVVYGFAFHVVGFVGDQGKVPDEEPVRSGAHPQRRNHVLVKVQIREVVNFAEDSQAQVDQAQ